MRAVTGYLELADKSLASGATADARLVLENVSALLPELTESDRVGVAKPYRTLQDTLSSRK